MLSSVTIRHFKSYRDATLKLAPLTVLVGANASGKSNAIEAIRLLSWIAAGHRIESIRQMMDAPDQAIRGRIDDLVYGKERAFSFSCQVDRSPRLRYDITIEQQGEGGLSISHERLEGTEASDIVPLFKVYPVQLRGHAGSVAEINFWPGGENPQITCDHQMAMLPQVASAASFSDELSQRRIPAAALQMIRQLANVTLLDPRPSDMREYSFASQKKLTRSGKHLSSVLYNLCRKKTAREELLDFVRALPEQNIRKIDFIRTPRREVMVTLTETFGGRDTTYDASLLSDGTLRVLAIAAAVLSSPPGLVVIEEVDNGVHPSRAGRLIELVSRIARRRKLRVLLSTHNPALLNALPDDAIPHVVFCYRDPDDGSSQLISLQDVPDYPELIAQGPVGSLMTRGILDRFVKNHPGPEERKRRVRAWIEDLQQQAR